MLTEFIAQDFQSIAKEGFYLSPFTVLVGPSNSGKSAVIRALEAVIDNTRSPQVRAGKNQTTLSLKVSEGTEIMLVRGKAKAEYDVDDKHYTKVGTAPLDAVHEKVRIDTSLQVAHQLARPYLLDSTGREVASTIGALTGADIITAAAAPALATSQRAARSATEAQERAKALQARLDTLPNPDVLENAADKATEFLRVVDDCLLLVREIQTHTAILSNVPALKLVKTKLLEADDSLVMAELKVMGAEVIWTSIMTYELAVAKIEELTHYKDTLEYAINQIQWELAQPTELVPPFIPLPMPTIDGDTCPTCGQRIGKGING